MLNRRIHTTTRAVLVGAALALLSPELALADVVADPPAAASRRRPHVPTSSPPLVVAEPDGSGPTPDVAVPVSDAPVGEAPVAEPVPLAVPEPVPVIAPEPVPESRPAATPPETARVGHPVPSPSGRLPTTGGVTAVALAGAFLSLGGLCVGAGRHSRSRVGSRDGFSPMQLLSLVWGFDGYQGNLVEVHVSALRRKLEALGGSLVHTERGEGCVLRPALPGTGDPGGPPSGM